MIAWIGFVLVYFNFGRVTALLTIRSSERNVVWGSNLFSARGKSSFFSAARRHNTPNSEMTASVNGYNVEGLVANEAARVHFEDFILSMPNARFCDHEDAIADTAEPINSLLFTSESDVSKYILVILPSNARVDEALLSQTVGFPVSLAKSSTLVSLCGFSAGTIPPFGFLDATLPIMTIVDTSLRDKQVLIAGGGVPNRSLITSFATIVEHSAQPVSVVSICKDKGMPIASIATKPFFPIEPPRFDIPATTKLNNDDAAPLTIVGRIRAVRRMSKDLAFCDLDPPKGAFDSAQSWRAPMTGHEMAVQLIAGKTLERFSPGACRPLEADQLVMVNGFINSNSEASIRNWHSNATLDITVSSFSILEERRDKTRVEQKVARRRQVAQVNAPVDPSECLQLVDVYNNIDDSVVIVDDMTAIHQFAVSLKQILQSPDSAELQMVGIDCEWLPSYLLEDSRTPQPVLLLQICLHSIQKVYLFDLQTLLRPLLSPTQKMDKLEKEVSIALSALFESKKIVKVGFQIAQDLRLLAASYPHVEALQFYNSVLECSTLGKKALRMANIADSKEVTSSLGRMTEHFVGKTLNKAEQCSDWSSRPLSSEQIAYAAMDAIVTPLMIELIVNDSAINWYGASFGFDENDHSLRTLVASWRFVVFEAMNAEMQRKLRARRAVGDALVIAQSWTTGDIPPQIPIPEIGDGSYRDTSGRVQVPAKQLAIQSPHALKLNVGKLFGQTKQKCLAGILEKSPSGNLDFPSRKGFIEFSNAFALFVNLPAGTTYAPRLYPNKWLGEGRILTFYVRESEYGGFMPREGSTPKNIVLFVRRGAKGQFVFCGSCRASQVENQQSWSLVEIHLELMDWMQLQDKSLFTELVDTGP